jgi:hypothetical protein
VQFVDVVMGGMPGSVTTEPFLEALAEEFGATAPAHGGSGSRAGAGEGAKLPLPTLLHLLCEVDTPTALTLEEANELLKLTGILAELSTRDAGQLAATQVDFPALVRHMMFPLPRRKAETAVAGAGGGARDAAPGIASALRESE